MAYPVSWPWLMNLEDCSLSCRNLDVRVVQGLCVINKTLESSNAFVIQSVEAHQLSQMLG